MNQDTVINLATQAMTIGVEVAGPMLLAGLAIGLAISIFQAVTSIQEQTLTFIPKVIALALIIVVLGPWMLRQIVDYTENLYQSIPTLISGG